MNARSKILFSTVYRRYRNDYYDWFGSNVSTPYKFLLVRRLSFGLRFIKQNIPEIEILEYPSWDEYVERLKDGWDVVGLSFYQNEIPEILQMADQARRQGVKELWAGNYGALTEGIESQFDRIFIGYAEHQIAQLLGKKIERISHPPLFLDLYLSPLMYYVGFRYKIIGVLFTQRGCPFRCRFCQTPAFCPKPIRISLESVEEVLKHYSNLSIKEVIILDENFCTFRPHSTAVIELLRKYGFYWSVPSRAEEMLEHFDYWRESRLASGMVGIESLSQATLDDIDKRESIETIKELTDRMRKSNLFYIGYYIIGYENDTEDSIRSDISELSEMGVDFSQLCVVTPFPRTALWDEISTKYGIFEEDWHKWDAKHLVWNHPHITPQKMEEILLWSFKKLNPPSRYFKNVMKWVNLYLEHEGNLLAGFKYISYLPVHAFFFNMRSQSSKVM